MVLETLKPDALVNVRNLTIEGPPKPDPFEITPSDWQGMSEYLLNIFEFSNHTGVVQMSKLMKVLSPEKRNHVISGWNLGVDYFTSPTMPTTDPTYLANIKILFPDSDPLSYPDNNRILFIVNRIVTRIRPQLITSDLPLDISDIATNWPKVLTIFPHLAESTPIAKEKVEQITSKLETRYKGAANYPEVLSRIRLFIPKDLIPGEIDSKDWDNLVDRLTKYRATNNWPRFGQTAEVIKILRADEVHITENGWEFKMPPSQSGFQTAPPPLPEARRF